MIKHLSFILMVVCTLISSAQTSIDEVRQATQAICNDRKLMKGLCGNVSEFNHQLVIIPPDEVTPEKLSINFLCNGYSNWITSVAEAFFRDLGHNVYYLTNWIETTTHIEFVLTPKDSPSNSMNSPYKISLSKTANGLKITSYQKL